MAAFDQGASGREVNQAVAKATRWYPWVGLAAFVTVFLQSALGTIVFASWFVLLWRSMQRTTTLRRELEALAAAAALQHRQEIRAFEDNVLCGLDRGVPAAFETMLRRWEEARPETVREVTLGLTRRAGCWRLTGRGIVREHLPTGVAHLGRGRRFVEGKRASGEIDADLAELNVGTVLSALFALFDNERPQDVDVVVEIDTPAGLIPWVALRSQLSHASFARLGAACEQPTTAWHLLGGRYGSCRAQRYTPALLPADTSMPRAVQRRHLPAMSESSPNLPHQTAPEADFPRVITREMMLGGCAGGQEHHAAPDEDVPRVMTRQTMLGGSERGEMNRHREAVPLPSLEPPRVVSREVMLGAASGSVGTEERAEKIPPPPSRRPVSDVPEARDLSGAYFGVLAQKYAEAGGNPQAPFVPFESYWPTYQVLSQPQLNFYFGWRTRVRRGESPQTDLSYVFIHIYELLHLAGCAGIEDATQCLERVWLAYRATWPKLDRYLVPWVADLLAVHQQPAAVLQWYRRVSDREASPGDAVGAVIMTDLYWREGDYRSLPDAILTTLVAEPRLGGNKFGREHNGTGWVGQGYREALVVTDRVFRDLRGTSLREAALASPTDHVTLARVPFQSAIYDWKRPAAVSFGIFPDFEETKLVSRTFRGAVRYAENLMRKHRGFSGRLRGVELDPALAKALDQHFADWFQKTRTRTKVTINLERAAALQQESAEVRSILTGGNDGAAEREPTSETAAGSPGSAPPATGAQPTDHGPRLDAAPPGLLTDLTALEAALAPLPPAARAVIATLARLDWELPEQSPALRAAAGGALLGPIVDQINEASVAAVGDVLIAAEDGQYIVADDFRDEVHWIVKGTLEGFQTPPPPGISTSPAAASPADTAPAAGSGHPDLAQFGPAELAVLQVLTGHSAAVPARLDVLATSLGTMPLPLLDQTNEVALASSYCDLMIDTTASPPTLLREAETYARELLARVPTPAA